MKLRGGNQNTQDCKLKHTKKKKKKKKKKFATEPKHLAQFPKLGHELAPTSLHLGPLAPAADPNVDDSSFGTTNTITCFPRLLAHIP